MATLQDRNGSYRILFQFRKKQFSLPLGKIPAELAHAKLGAVEALLAYDKSGLKPIPEGVDIVEWLRHDGQPPENHFETVLEMVTLAGLRDRYLAAHTGSLEDNSLATIRVHFKHLSATLGESFDIGAVKAADLQRHIDRRRELVRPRTIRKELDTLRSAMRWARQTELITNDFPQGFRLPKETEKLPFMTREQIERKIAQGGDPETLWECLYLTEAEITEFLDFAAGREAPDWVYPFVLFCAHTGARRSEAMRAEKQDVDGDTITIREKKKTKGQYTTRRVPLSARLKAVLENYRCAGKLLFGQTCVQTVQKAFVRLVRGSKWEVLRGYHVCRHSFISALANRGVDPRAIMDMVGHLDDATARRYTHLTPETKERAIRGVFG